jgi:hypothetical protein
MFRTVELQLGHLKPDEPPYKLQSFWARPCTSLGPFDPQDSKKAGIGKKQDCNVMVPSIL